MSGGAVATPVVHRGVWTEMVPKLLGIKAMIQIDSAYKVVQLV